MSSFPFSHVFRLAALCVAVYTDNQGSSIYNQLVTYFGALPNDLFFHVELVVTIF